MLDVGKAVVFLIGKEEYALPIEYVVSIEKLENMTPIPNLPSYVKGITEVRDELIPVVDMENILFNRDHAVNEATRLIIIKNEEASFGALAADAKEIINILPGELKQIGFILPDTSFIAGVAKVDTRLIPVLNPMLLAASFQDFEEVKDYIQNFR